ncbi:hypothetical protein [Rhizosaccharibacter radicis]|uniref:Uncharacterized protein n=1 Tax=Rhizosaccharibacter radicis TaxID=2782605 RepID=A0ABT1VSL5_9PROT|nr:hypothetical protein [Acetobacteraceae bacterium KSS12]
MVAAREVPAHRSPMQTRHRILVLAALAAGMGAAPPSRFTAPMQPWRSADGRVALLRPAMVPATASDRPLGSLMSPGWRLDWDGSASRAGAAAGTMIIRLVLPVTPDAPLRRASEVLQVGASADAGAVSRCFTDGLGGPAVHRDPDRTINGVRFRSWHAADAGMSQRIEATDLRAVVDGRCVAVDRFRYGDSASDPAPDAPMPQARGRAIMDASLDSLRLGRAVEVPPLPALKLPPGAVAR